MDDVRKNSWKKLAVAACVLLLSALCVHTYARAEGQPAGNSEETVYGVFVNPLYEEAGADAQSEDTASEEEAAMLKSSGSVTYYADEDSAAAVLRAGMEARQTTITVGYAASQEYSGTQRLEVAKSIFEKAFAHTGVSTQGDYLRWSYGQCQAKISSSGTNYAITYTVSYYTTAEQEAELATQLSAVESSLGLSGMSAEQQIRTIYSYICSTVKYNYESGSMLPYTAYSALVNHSAVCQGISLLFYRMALDCGIDVRLVSGYSSTGVNHAWNLVKLGNAYYYLDPTYDLGASSWSWFLKGSSTFFPTHVLATSGQLQTTSSDLVKSYEVSLYDYGTQTTALNTVVQNGTGWSYVDGDGIFVSNYNGFAKNDCGWWYLEDGYVQFGVTGVIYGTVNGQSGWWYVKNGYVDFSYTGIAPNEYGWWRIVNGAVDFTCNSVECNEYGWFYIRGGCVDFSYTGIAPNEYGWWRIVNGAVDFTCNSVESNEYGWFCIRGGCVDFSYTGIARNAYGWWRIVNGAVDFNCNSVESSESGWFYIRGGCVDFGFTGIASNAYGQWYIKNGAVQFGYSGKVYYQGKSYRVSNGHAA